jgi:hypothetical protein
MAKHRKKCRALKNCYLFDQKLQFALSLALRPPKWTSKLHEKLSASVEIETNADPESGSQTNADLSGSGSWSDFKTQTVAFLHKKYI